MTEPTPMTPSPIAVPWTPDMGNAPSTPHMQAPAAPTQTSSQSQPYLPHPGQAKPVHPTPQAQNASHAQPMPQPYQTAQRPNVQIPTPVSAQAPVAAHPAQTYPTAHPSHMQPAIQHPPAPQAQRPEPMPPHNQQQHQTVQQPQIQHAPQPYAAHAPSHPPMAQHMSHAGPPPLTPQAQMHMQAAHMSEMYEEQPKSKSLLAGLLKRSPRPDRVATDMPAASTGRESLFNKNFMLGGLTGLVIGAFVLPIILGMFASDTPQPQARNFTQSSAAVTPPSTAEGGSFIDDAIASDAP